MPKSKYSPNENEKALRRRFLRALIDAQLDGHIDSAQVQITSSGFSIGKFSLNKMSQLTNEMEDLAEVARIQRNIRRTSRSMSESLEQSHRLPADYSRARVFKTSKANR
jgi:hypothetical protein